MLERLLRPVMSMIVPRRAVKAPSRTVAIVVPLSLRAELTPDEEVSMRHLTHFLGPYDKFLVAPRGSTITRPGFTTIHCDRKFFGTAAAHNRLVIRPDFYEAFEDYQYILVYHLDSLVLSDQLERWCQAGWDYIGAPWIPCPATPWVQAARVGNGGFALMNIESVLKVLYNRRRQEPAAYLSESIVAHSERFEGVFRVLERLHALLPGSRALKRIVADWRVSRNPASYGDNNDFFWSFQAVRYLPTFKVAPVEEGLRFAFEAAPSLCFELNRGELPFGCHAWTKFEKSFWQPFLLRIDASAEATA